MINTTIDVVTPFSNIEELARAAKRQATCDRGYVACVLRVRADDVDKVRHVIGYANSMMEESCDSHGHEFDERTGKCVRTVHAEKHAVATAAKLGLSTDGAECVVTRIPCAACLRVLKAAGVTLVRVLVDDTFDDTKFKERKIYADKLGILLVV